MADETDTRTQQESQKARRGRRRRLIGKRDRKRNWIFEAFFSILDVITSGWP